MMACLRWGICGAGMISNDFCAAMKTLPEGENEVVAVAARSRVRAAEFASKLGFKSPNIYDNYEDLAKDANVEVVYIGTIHINHVELSMMMLNAGKHVLCEKPMALNLKEAKKVLDLAKEKKLYFMEAIWSRAFPNYERIRQELANGTLGDVQLITVKFGVPNKDVERIKKKSLGGGAMLDFGLYTIQFATMVFDGMPEKITAEGALNEEGVDEQVCVILKYKGGKMASLQITNRTPILKNAASIHGSKGSIEVPDFFWCPPEIDTPSGHFENPVPESDVPYNFPNSGGMRYQADMTRTCIQQGKTECAVMTHRDSETVMAINDEIRRQLGVVYDVD